MAVSAGAGAQSSATTYLTCAVAWAIPGGGHLWMGRPAKRVRALNSQELDYLEYAAINYVRLKRRYAG